jgi:histidyl-tRNA synthetase
MVPTQFKDIKEALNDLLSSTELLDELGITYQIDLTSGKGFEYYTGIIFRLALNGQNIGGGGRYDALIPLLGGEKKAAAGFAIYMDRLVNVLAIEEENEAESVSITAVDGSEKMAFKYAEAMRQAGYCTVIKAGSTDNARWKLRIDNRGGISLIDDKIKKEYNTSSIEEAVATVRGENVL